MSVARRKWLSLVLLAAAGPEARAVVTVFIHDPVDDFALVLAVSGQKPVKEFAAEITAFRETLTASKEARIEKLLGKPVPRPNGDYAMPVGQPRGFSMSGLFHADKAQNKHHTEFYPIGDFAGIEVWYGIDGESPLFALLYFRVDKTFPKLREVKEKVGDKPAAPKKAQAAARKHTIDLDHWDKLKEGMSKAEVAELFSVPAGDYVPGTEYFTRSWGWRSGGSGKAVETLEWRGEKARILVSFDEKGKYVESEYFLPGRDPVTNVAERLKWDRERFDKLKKYVEERRAVK
jgi:hypothetical protein